jgi:hypothetical protein
MANHKVFIKNGGGLDAELFVEMAFQPTKQLLGSMFGTWDKIGWLSQEEGFRSCFL